MELWIFLVVAAQFLYAIAILIDKYLVSTPELPRPVVYAFYVAMLSLVALVVLPFGAVSIPSGGVFVYAVVSGVLYVLGILSLFTSLKRAEASDVVPIVGVASSLVAFIVQFFFFDDSLPPHFLGGFVLLVVGTALLSHYRLRWKGFFVAVGAGVFLGLSTLFVKMVFGETTFANGFFWTRMANVVAGATLLLWPPVWYAVTKHEREPAKRAGRLIILAKVISGAAFLLVLMAIAQGNVSIINAMQGLQFVFLLIFASGCSFWMPLCFSDAHGQKKLLQKIIATGVIVAGFFVLFLS